VQYGEKKETKYKPHSGYEKDSDYKHKSGDSDYYKSGDSDYKHKSDKYDDDSDYEHKVHKYEDDGESTIWLG
jgi:hypothetical protein